MSEGVSKTRTIDALLAEYGESHQNAFNKKIHWVAVPVIFWTVVALLWSITVPAIFSAVPMLNWATILMVLTILYYVMMSPMLAIGMTIFSAFCIYLVQVFEQFVPVALWQGALAIFVVAWIAQFWGHKVEGKKPSFFKDVQFLLVGPAWLMSFVYQRLGIKY